MCVFVGAFGCPGARIIAVVNHPTWVLGIKLMSSPRSVHTQPLNLLSTPHILYFKEDWVNINNIFFYFIVIY